MPTWRSGFPYPHQHGPLSFVFSTLGFLGFTASDSAILFSKLVPEAREPHDQVYHNEDPTFFFKMGQDFTMQP